MNTSHYLTFQVGRQVYGTPVNLVIEVLQMVALDELPSTQDDFLGLLTLRNTVMPVIDLRKKFITGDTTLSLSTPLIAIQHGEQHFALAVDVVEDVIDVSSATWQEQDSDPYVTNTMRIEDRLIFILNVEQFHISNLREVIVNKVI